jgi:hypothetical protein
MEAKRRRGTTELKTQVLPWGEESIQGTESGIE